MTADELRAMSAAAERMTALRILSRWVVRGDIWRSDDDGSWQVDDFTIEGHQPLADVDPEAADLLARLALDADR